LDKKNDGGSGKNDTSDISSYQQEEISEKGGGERGKGEEGKANKKERGRGMCLGG